MPRPLALSAALSVALVMGAALAQTPAPGGGATVSPAEQVSRGVVTVERDGRVIAVGEVLGGDGEGRILTALSPLGANTQIDVRYADGSVVQARVGHRNATWDLALLVPLTGRWLDGLQPSAARPESATLETPVALRPGRPSLLPARLRGTIEARAKDGSEPLPAVLDVDVQGGAPTLGAPLIDGNAGVVGVFVSACRPSLPAIPSPTGAPPVANASACVPIVVAAPVAAVGEFLRTAPPGAVVTHPWLGVVVVPDSQGNARGVRVTAVAPDSPAEKGGLKGGDDRAQADMIIAVDGQPIESAERLQDIISHHASGDRLRVIVVRGGTFREATVTLRALGEPEPAPAPAQPPAHCFRRCAAEQRDAFGCCPASPHP